MTVQTPASPPRPLQIIHSGVSALLLCALVGSTTAALGQTRAGHTGHKAVSKSGHAAPAHAVPRTGAHAGHTSASRAVKGHTIVHGRTAVSRGHAAVSGRSYSVQESVGSHEARDPQVRLDMVNELSYGMAHGGSALSQTAALDSFYAALADHQDDPSSSTVRVLQFGDSHTAADMFTGETRRIFQEQFGNGGIGYSYAGHPFAGYRVYGSQRSQSSGWTTLGTHFLDLGDAELGLGGVAITTSLPGQDIMLETPCTSFELQFLRQPGGGPVQVTDNGAVVGQVDTSGDFPAGDAFDYNCPASYSGEGHRFVVTTQDHAPVRLLGTVTLQPGVTWEAIGINGAQAPLMLQWNQPIFTSYLEKTNAALIVLAYGTNEAAAPHWTYELYRETFGRLVDLIHRTVPGAAVLVLGPADRSIAVGRHGYAPFSGTEHIVEAQREVCRTHNCAYWDTQKRMGGFGSMQRWVYGGWAQHDHTHMNADGYHVLADALMADLLSGYDSYRVANAMGPSPIRGASSTAASATPSSAPDVPPKEH